MKKEIGSNFWEYNDKSCENEEWKPLEEYYKEYFFVSGRNAIFTLCNNIKTEKKVALLPAFTCETVIEPFAKAGWQLNFYSINKDLTISNEELSKQIERIEPNLVLFHSYFGFNTYENNKALIENIRKKKITIVEDITQNLFSKFKRVQADYYVASLRKWFAIPDGGILIIENKDNDFSFNYSNCINEIYIDALKAFKDKKSYMEDNDYDEDKKTRFMNEYQNIKEKIANVEDIEEMSEKSKNIFKNVDRKKLKDARRKNYNFLIDNLMKFDKDIEIIIDKINDDEVPLYCPIYIKDNREDFQRYMANNRIYCPIIWGRPKYVKSENDVNVNYIYNHILSIPCDQRYDEEDMKRIIDTIELYYR